MAQLNELLMPKLGLTMTEGTLTEWAVAPGETVEEGALLFVVETDKVANEVCAGGAGEIVERLVEAGETVPVGTVVARWSGPGNAADSSADQLEAGDGSVGEDPTGSGVALAAAVAASAPSALPGDAASARIVATPYARRLARAADIDLANVPLRPSKKRLYAADVRQFAREDSSSVSEAVPTHEQGSGEAATVMSAPAHTRAMAARMVQAKTDTPHFYLFSEANVGALLDLLETLNADEAQRRITLNDCMLMATTRALQWCPAQNCIWRDGEIVQFNGVDLGMAVATDNGLMAPVLADVGRCSLDELSDRAAKLACRARTGALTRSDTEGGALTVSNGGMFGVTHMAPIINPPQSAILGIGSVRSVFRPDSSGAPVLRHELGIVYAGDHRLHDGRSGLEFLNCVISLIETPLRLLRDPQQQ